MRFFVPSFLLVTAACTQQTSSPIGQGTEAKVTTGCVVPLAQYRSIWFSDSGERLVVEGDFGAAIFEPATWQPVGPCPLRYPERVQAVSADARSIAVRTKAGIVEAGPIGGPYTTVIPAADTSELSLLGFGADAVVLAALRGRHKPGQTLELWKVGSHERPWSRAMAPNNVSAPAWSKDRRLLAISNGSVSISIVPVSKDELAIDIPVAKRPQAMLFSLDGSRLAVSFGKTVGIFDTRSGSQITEVTIPNNRSGLRPIAFGTTLLITDLGWSFAAFEPATGAPQSSFVLRRQPPRGASGVENEESVKSWAHAASSDGVLLVAYPEADYNLVLLDAGAGRQVGVLSPLYTYGQRPAIGAMAISPAKDFVVVGVDTGDLRTWSLIGKGSNILQTTAMR